MAVLHHIDNEVAGPAEWNAIVETGAATIIQTPDAAFPGRGRLGLRATVITAGHLAYAQKTVNHTLAAGASVYVGVWIKVQSLYPSGRILELGSAAWTATLYFTAGVLRLYIANDAGISSYDTLVWPGAGEWFYAVVKLTRASSNVASDGSVEAWINGAAAGSVTGIDNYDRAPNVQYMRAGLIAYTNFAPVIDFDEIKIGTSYPEPYVPTPETDYLEPARLCVLYRTASSDSRDFADYCAERLGVPLANLIPLPNATADETLADYATFQAEVENDIAAYFTLNPTVASNCCGFLIGYGVPGYFTVGGVSHSATSRLNRYGTAFSSQTDNPFYQRQTRITATELGAEGLYLATRIDAPSLDDAKDLLDKAISVNSLEALPETDVLNTDDEDFSRQDHYQEPLLVRSTDMEILQNSGFFFGSDTNLQTIYSSGSRVSFVETSSDCASSLRSTSTWLTQSLFNAGFASALGSADEPFDAFDIGSFFGTLLSGGTIAEAFFASTSRLDSTNVSVGSPLLEVNRFPKRGHKLYIGMGGLESIDWQNPIAYARQDAATLTLPVSLQPELPYALVARAVSALGVEERNTHVLTYVEINGDGDLQPTPLAALQDVTVEVESQQSIILGFSWSVPAGWSNATEFEVFSDNGTGELDLQNPVATVTDIDTRQSDYEVHLTPQTLPAKFAVRARCDSEIGPLSQTVTASLQPSPTAPALL